MLVNQIFDPLKIIDLLTIRCDAAHVLGSTSELRRQGPVIMIKVRKIGVGTVIRNFRIFTSGMG
jgi:hypothetical protein